MLKTLINVISIILQNITSQNVKDYKEQLMLVLTEESCDDICASENIQYWMDTFQSAIDKGNEKAHRRRKR